MTEYEEHFRKLLEEAKAEGKILKYVADFKDGKAKVGLQKISPESDLYHLRPSAQANLLQVLQQVCLGRRAQVIGMSNKLL